MRKSAKGWTRLHVNHDWAMFGRLWTRVRWLLVFGMGLVALSCSSKEGGDGEAEHATLPKVNYTIEHLEQSGWLYKNAPSDTLAYLRLPSLRALFSARDGSFEAAQGNPAHVQEVKKLLVAIQATLTDQVPSEFAPIVEFFVGNVMSPLELLVTGDAQNPMGSRVLGSVTLDYSPAELNSALEQLLKMAPLARILQPMNDAGIGQVGVGPMVLVYQYTDQKKFHFLLGMGLANDNLTEALANLKPGQAPGAFVEMEQSIDDQGKGMVLWLNTGDAMSAMQTFIPSGSLPFEDDIFTNSLNSIAMGFGVSKSKGRLRVVADVPAESIVRQFVPAVNTQHSVKTVGDPTFLMQINFPLAENLNQYRNWIETSMDDGEPSTTSFSDEFKSLFGFSLETLIQAYGPELSLFKDNLGYFIVVKIKDRAAHNKVSEALPEFLARAARGEIELPVDDEASEYAVKFFQGMTYRKQRLGEVDIHYARMPSMYGPLLESPEISEQFPSALMKFFTGGNSHYYWLDEGDNLVVSVLPQDLRERIASVKANTLDGWLKSNGVDGNSSLLALSTSLVDSPRNYYHAYLSLLQSASDSVDADIDMFAFPTASDVNLPREGIYSFQIDSTARLLSAEFTYEQSLVDVIFGLQGGMSGVAVVGILAAVAIPAYQDYVTRAQISGVYIQSQPLRLILAEFYAENNRLPTELEANEMALYLSHEWVSSVYFAPSSNALVMEIDNGNDLEGNLFLIANIADGKLEYKCESDLPDKVLPISCRSGN